MGARVERRFEVLEAHWDGDLREQLEEIWHELVGLLQFNALVAESVSLGSKTPPNAIVTGASPPPAGASLTTSAPLLDGIVGPRLAPTHLRRPAPRTSPWPPLPPLSQNSTSLGSETPPDATTAPTGADASPPAAGCPS
eukprot:NODE_5149_length_609_cov_136.416968.p3 GENE.NODE_5149_length_609_cov_136.416968~~NODE_5149_length_609_cov_136.416968.p3  ORF type:complete len:139 (+),score=25.42 NODE_5149_length_609_cov_136.416968:3-419(+)